jgi:transposase InsO family protein
MPPVKTIKCNLVLVDTFTGWVEAFPTMNKKTSTITTILVTGTIPWFGLPASIQSDNGSEFVSSISQKLAQALNIHWRFHIPYHPQSSGKVEHANHTLKNTLTKLSLELHLDWTKLLSLVLLHLQALPCSAPLSSSMAIHSSLSWFSHNPLTFPPLSSILSSLFFALFFGRMLMISYHSPLTPPK